MLVWAEQGLGDFLMMARFINEFAQFEPKSLTVYCPESLRAIAAALPTVTDVMTEVDALDPSAFDMHCPVMSLPLAFGIDIKTVSADVPYLVLDPVNVARWSKRLAGDGRRRVGIAWAGGPYLRDNSARNVPLAEFATLFDISGLRWISLQKGYGRVDLKSGEFPVEDYMDECTDFMDTASLIANLDLVIAVDTAVVHAVGALGKPVWLLNRAGSEWRWGTQGQTSRWYPTLIIYRQDEPHAWQPVITRIRQQLEPAH